MSPGIWPCRGLTAPLVKRRREGAYSMKSTLPSKSVAVEVADRVTNKAHWSAEPVPPSLRSSPAGNTSPQFAPAENDTLCSHRIWPMVGGVDHVVYHSEFAAMSSRLVLPGVAAVVPTPDVVSARVNLTDEFGGNGGLLPDGHDPRRAIASAETVAPAVASRMGVCEPEMTATRPDVTV